MKKRTIKPFLGALALSVCVGLVSPLSAQAAETPEYVGANYHGNIDIPGEVVESIYEDEIDMLAAEAALPAKYDARSKKVVTPVKNQNPYGTCWSFSTMAALEGSWASLQGKTLDLSEYHLVNYTFHSVQDPLGGTAGDSMTFSGDVYEMQNAGGNVSVSYHVLANWVGAVNESVTGYPGTAQLPATAKSAYLNDVVHLQQAYKISKSDRATIKAAIMNYGTVTTSYYHSNSYYNSSKASYYNNYNTSSNHAVSIVGWDDNYSKNNFVQKPSSNGAWLVKNSWGTNWGAGGYFWMSYEDTSMQSALYVLIGESADNYDNNYQYDGACMPYYFSYNYYSGTQQTTAANVFTVKGSTYEELKAVSFDIDSPNVNYSIQIYTDLTNASDPTSGKAQLSKPVTGKTSFQGYYTVKLPTTVMLAPNKKYSVVITFSKEGSIRIGSEGDYYWSNGLNFQASAKANQSFVKNGTGSWMDFGSRYGGNLRIKAFTDETGSVLPFKDVKSTHWAYNSIVYVYQNGIMSGKANGTFGVGKKMTNEEFIQVLYAYAGKPAVTYKQQFSDVKSSDYFAKAVTWAKAKGITSGNANGTFGVGKEITRERFITLLYNYAKSQGKATGTTSLSSFADANKVSTYSKDAMAWAVKNGMISGKSRNGKMYLDPQNGTYREECATIMKAYDEYVK